jgi:hypothetical protein
MIRLYAFQEFPPLAHTTNPSNPVAIIAKIIPSFPNVSFFPLSWQIM